jgi:hypothetical protein
LQWIQEKSPVSRKNITKIDSEQASGSPRFEGTPGCNARYPILSLWASHL